MRTLFSAVVLVLAFPLALLVRLAPKLLVNRAFRSLSGTAASAADSRPVYLRRAYQRAHGCPFYPRALSNCLSDAWAATVAARLVYGVHPMVQIGCARRDGKLVFHAWCELDGEPITNPGRNMSPFVPSPEVSA